MNTGFPLIRKWKIVTLLLLILLLTTFAAIAQDGDGDEGSGIGIATEDPAAPTDLPEPESVWSVAWDPDGTQLAVGISPDHCGLTNNSYATHIIDAVTQQNIINLNTGYKCPITYLEWSADGEDILTGTREGGAVWNASTGDLKSIIRVLHSPTGTMLDYDWSPDSSRIVTIEDTSPYILIWDPLTDDNFSLNGTNPNSAVWSPDSTKLAVLDPDIVIRDSKTWKIIATLPVRGSRVTWSPDGGKFAGIDAYNNIIISDTNNGNILNLLSGHTDQITAFEWRADSKLLASASIDKTVRLWDVETGSQIALLPNSDPLYALDWKPDGTQLAYGGLGSITPKIVSVSEMITLTATPVS